MKTNIKLIIEYDGTNYGGWQRQKNSPSIQEELEGGLFRLTGEKVPLYGAGRTDSGVHARGQVANFHTSSKIPPERFSFALNSIIPRDIRVVDSSKVASDFHARFSAKARRYSYSLTLSPHASAIGRNYSLHIPVKLDIASMEKGLAFFKGSHDFRAFQGAGSQAKTTVRTIYDIGLEKQGNNLRLIITGSGFLYNMVRIIAGTLIYVGKGKISYSEIEDIIKSGDRRVAGPTAPARGLCLERVYYSHKFNPLP